MDNPVFIPEDMSNGYNSSSTDKMRSSNQRLSHYYRSPSSHHSSSSASASSYHNLIPPSSSYYYPQQAEFPLPASTMWHLNGRYREDELPNIPSNMAAAMFPRYQTSQNSHMHMPNRRFSLAAIPSSNSKNPYAQVPQRRRISVTKYLDIPSSNYLKVPSFHDYDAQTGYQQANPSSTLDYVEYKNVHSTPSQSKVSSRRRSEGSIPKVSPPRDSKLLPGVTSRSRSPDPETPGPIRRSPSLDGAITPDPTKVPVPAFEFNSSHLPLRPPAINVNKYSSGSGSTSTPESQRIESRQMIRSTSSKIHSPKIEVRRDSRIENGKSTALSDRKIWSITKPNKWCRHGDAKNCKDCNMKMETMSQCSSVNPPPTFTAMDNYQPVRRKNKCSFSCGMICRISIILAVIVMLFISAFILYVELVLKHQTANVMDKM